MKQRKYNFAVFVYNTKNKDDKSCLGTHDTWRDAISVIIKYKNKLRDEVIAKNEDINRLSFDITQISDSFNDEVEFTINSDTYIFTIERWIPLPIYL